MSPSTWFRFVGLSAVAVASLALAGTEDAPKDKEKSVKDKDAFTNSIGMKLVRVKAGKFMMGSPEDEKGRYTDEEQHEVEITKDFYLGVVEVTQGQWKKVMKYNPSHFSKDGKAKGDEKYAHSDPAGGKAEVGDKDTDDFPVENVSWQDARDFLKELTRLEAKEKNKREYRLPTEAEWEYACRCGPVFKDNKVKAQLPFHFKTPSASLGSGQANFDARHPYGGGKKGDESKRTNTVGKNGEANSLGIHDMHGNVSEWCSDWYAAYNEKERKDPQGPKDGESRVLRGGSRESDGRNCRAAYRNSYVPGLRSGGFRAVCVVVRD